MAAPHVQATTFRLDPRVKAGLQKLSTSANVTMNKLVNEALGAYVERRLAAEAADLEALVTGLRAYRARDSGYERAIAAVVDAETSGIDDPAEGTIDETAGSTEREILHILNG